MEADGLFRSIPNQWHPRLLGRDGGLHLVEHLAQGEVHPTVAFAGAIDDLADERRVGFGEKRVEEVDSVVEEVVIRFAGGDVELAAELGPSVFQSASSTRRRSYFFHSWATA